MALRGNNQACADFSVLIGVMMLSNNRGRGKLRRFISSDTNCLPMRKVQSDSGRLRHGADAFALVRFRTVAGRFVLGEFVRGELGDGRHEDFGFAFYRSFP
jgi:hypothetical protein